MNTVCERFAVITVAASKGQPVLLHNSNFAVNSRAAENPSRFSDCLVSYRTVHVTILFDYGINHKCEKRGSG